MNGLTRAECSVDDAHVRARGALSRVALHQSATLAYIDALWALGVAGAIMLFLSFTLNGTSLAEARCMPNSGRRP